MKSFYTIFSQEIDVATFCHNWIIAKLLRCMCAYLKVHMYNLEWMEMIGNNLQGWNIEIFHWLFLLLQNFPDILLQLQDSQTWVVPLT